MYQNIDILYSTKSAEETIPYFSGCPLTCLREWKIIPVKRTGIKRDT